MFIYLIIKNLLLYTPLSCATYISAFLLQFPALALESASITGALTAVLLHNQFPALPCLGLIAAAALGACVVGMLIGIMHIYGGVSPLLSNLIMMGLLNGLNQYVMGSAHLSCQSMITISPLFLIILGALIALSIVIIFCTTQIGYASAVYGRNNIFLQKQQVSSTYVLITCLGISYALAGINGFIIAGIYGFIDLAMMVGTLLMTFTANIIGTMGFAHKPPAPLAPLIGLVLYLSLQQTLLTCGFASRYFTALQAALLLCLIVGVSKKHTSTSFSLGF